MRPNFFDGSDSAEAVVADVFDFVASLPDNLAARLITFFHLVELDGRAKVEFKMEPSGRLTLRIEADGTKD